MPETEEPNVCISSSESAVLRDLFRHAHSQAPPQPCWLRNSGVPGSKEVTLMTPKIDTPAPLDRLVSSSCEPSPFPCRLVTALVGECPWRCSPAPPRFPFLSPP